MKSYRFTISAIVTLVTAAVAWYIYVSSTAQPAVQNIADTEHQRVLGDEYNALIEELEQEAIANPYEGDTNEDISNIDIEEDFEDPLADELFE